MLRATLFLFFLGLGCAKPDLQVTPADKTPRLVEDSHPNDYILKDTDVIDGVKGLELSQAACPQGMVADASYQTFSVDAHEGGLKITLNEDPKNPADVLAILVTTPDAVLPRGPDKKVERGRSFWVTQTRSFPREPIGQSPFIYGVVPDNGLDITHVHGPFLKGQKGSFSWPEVEAGTCVLVSLVTNDMNSVQINSYLYRNGERITCGQNEELRGGKCVPKLQCGPFEIKKNGRCEFVPSKESCQSLPSELIYLEGACRSPDYCGPDKEVKGSLCVEKDPGIEGVHCRFEFFGAPSCMDYRGTDWQRDTALSLCRGLNGGVDEAVLAPGGCKVEAYDSLCETNVASSVYLPKKVPGLVWRGGEYLNLFAVGFPEVFCQPETDQWIKGTYSGFDPDKGWNKSSWVPLDFDLSLEDY